MRDRFVELLPLLLVGVILLVFQFTRADSPGLSFLPLFSPTPATELVAPTPQAARSRNPVAVAGATVTSVACLPGLPRFVGSMAVLRVAVGSRMGDPLECERSINGLGDTQQQTSTGLAYRLKEFTCFTTGWEHWALRDDGSVVYWASDSVGPPLDAIVVTSH